jgi:hypothetical protein
MPGLSNAASPRHEGRARKIVVCHHGHENDATFAENIFEFCSAHGVAHDCVDLRFRSTRDELRRHLSDPKGVSLLGFNSQLDHAWLDSEPVLLAAARQGITVVQWMFDHPGCQWAEFSFSDPATSRFLFHSPFSQAYFQKFCCSGAATATAGSIGPNWRSRAAAEDFEAFARRPVACLIALGLARLGKSARELDAEIEALGSAPARILRDAFLRARLDLDGPLELHLCATLEEEGLKLDAAAFHRYFCLLNHSVQYFRRSRIIRVASRFRVNIQSDTTADALLEGGAASFRQNVSTAETLGGMPLCRSVLSVSPVNDSIHDRTCNALNAGCLPILEDNRAHRALFRHGENALLFRYDDDSLAECLTVACGGLEAIYPMARHAKAMRDEAPFRFGSFRNILALAGLDEGSV